MSTIESKRQSVLAVVLFLFSNLFLDGIAGRESNGSRNPACGMAQRVIKVCHYLSYSKESKELGLSLQVGIQEQ